MKTNKLQYSQTHINKLIFSALLFFMAINFSINAHSQIINTVVGTTMGYSGDGGPATAAQIEFPDKIAFDGFGNMYFTDVGVHVVRKVDAITHVITTVAGNGTAGFSGDGGAATNAQLNAPEGIAVDAIGTIYIADQVNERIRKVNTSGIISTIAGTGSGSYSGDGGPATAAVLGTNMFCLILNGSDLYVGVASVVRKIDLSSGIITKFAGTPGSISYTGDGGAATAATFNSVIGGLRFDATGNLLICDALNNVIRKVDLSGTVTTIAGTGVGGYSGDGGPATSAQFYSPVGIDVDLTTGDVFIADSYNNIIRKIDGTTNVISTFAGNGYGAGVGTGNFFGDGGPAIAAEFYSPWDVVLDPCKNVYIADIDNSVIREVYYTSPILGPKSVCVGSTITLSDIVTGGTWTSGVTTVATIGTSSGIVTGIAIGTTTITYTTPCFEVYDTITVVNMATIFGPTSVCEGATITLSSSPSTGTWSSSATAIADVGSSTGVVSGVSAGTATITFVSACGTATYAITVNPTPIITGSRSLCGTITTSLSCSPGGGVWSSSNTSIATITVTSSTTADLHGVSMGTTIISYILPSGCYTSVLATVASLTGITGPTSVCIGSPITLSTTSVGGSWSSSNTSRATVGSSSGIVTGVSAGTVNIFYTNACGTISYTVTVNLTPTITSTPAACVGLTSTAMTATPGGGTWSSSNPGVGSINSTSGVLTGVSGGTTTLTYTSTSGCTATATATITTQPDGCIFSSIIAGEYYYTFTGTPGVTIYFTIGLGSTVYGYDHITVPSGSITIAASTIQPAPYRLCIDTVELNGCYWTGCNCSVSTLNCCASINPLGYKQGNSVIAAQLTDVPESGIIVIPNPTKGQLSVQGILTGNSATAIVELVDVLGKVVYTSTTTLDGGRLFKAISLDDGIPSGVYLVRVKNGDVSKVVRFTLER